MLVCMYLFCGRNFIESEKGVKRYTKILSTLVGRVVGIQLSLQFISKLSWFGSIVFDPGRQEDCIIETKDSGTKLLVYLKTPSRYILGIISFYLWRSKT